MDDCEDQVFEGISGDDLSIPVQLLDGDGNPEDVSAGAGMTEIVAEFTDGNGAVVPISYTGGKISLVNAVQGRISIEIAAATSATLKTSKTVKQTFDVYRVKGGKKRTWLFEGALLLKPRPVPA